MLISKLVLCIATIAGKKSALRNIREPVLLNLGLAYTDEPDVIFLGIVSLKGTVAIEA